MTTSEHFTTPPKRRKPWLRSLRWRLTVLYVGILAIILTILGGFLLFTVQHLLTASTATNFVDSAHTVAITRNQAFLNDVFRKDAVGDCSTNFADAFQQVLSDPLTQSPAQFTSVLLLDRYTGVVLSPTASAGIVPPELNFKELAALRATVGSTDAAWMNGVARSAGRAYRVNVGGVPGGVILIAYNYRVVTSCTSHASRLYPAVLMLESDYSRTLQIITSFKILLGVSVGLLFVFGLAVGIPLTGASLGPLSQVTTTARRLAAGDLSQRVQLRQRYDEVGELAQTVDEMAQALEVAFDRLQSSEERMREFISNASHELRTPITAIRGCLEVLERNGYDDPREMDRLISAARREADRMRRLVDDLLMLARFDNGRPLDLDWTNFAQLARDTVEQLQIIASERNVAIDAPDTILALVDADRIKQVILALGDNALKYGRQDQDGWVHLVIHASEAAVVLTVSDNGPGIDPADLPQIFNRFFRARQLGATQTSNGSGLGLAIVKSIINAHGGTIAVESVPGMGTTFTIVLPIAGKPEAEMSQRPTRPLEAWSSGDLATLVTSE